MFIQMGAYSTDVLGGCGCLFNMLTVVGRACSTEGDGVVGAYSQMLDLDVTDMWHVPALTWLTGWDPETLQDPQSGISPQVGIPSLTC
jgi:hypothetical protein